jgi:hypothetical protein
MELFTKFINILIFERSPIISDDRIGDSISANDIIQDEKRDLFTVTVVKGTYSIHFVKYFVAIMMNLCPFDDEG